MLRQMTAVLGGLAVIFFAQLEDNNEQYHCKSYHFHLHHLLPSQILHFAVLLSAGED
ncbi:MAG TPA: hypothetical protein PKD52_11360 [Clostridiales bacterium]|nr:hypothetical protein [Clostridiales bacterium]